MAVCCEISALLKRDCQLARARADMVARRPGSNMRGERRRAQSAMVMSRSKRMAQSGVASSEIEPTSVEMTGMA